MQKNELWQEYGINGEPLQNGGLIPYPAQLIRDHKICGVVTIWLYRHAPEGLALLFQKRSQFVDRNASKWDISAGGHMNYQETPLESAVREAREEIGVDLAPAKLHYLFSEATNLHVHHTFAYDWTEEPDQFHFDDQEVETVKWVPFTEVDEFRSAYAKTQVADDDTHFMLLRQWFQRHGDI